MNERIKQYRSWLMSGAIVLAIAVWLMTGSDEEGVADVRSASARSTAEAPPRPAFVLGSKLLRKSCAPYRSTGARRRHAPSN